jgi:hypothetical protein
MDTAKLQTSSPQQRIDLRRTQIPGPSFNWPA